MRIEGKSIKWILVIIAGVLFQGIQILVLLHFILIDHHYSSQSEKARFTVESNHPCQVKDYFNNIYPEDNNPNYSTNIRKPVHVKVPELESCFSIYEVCLMSARGPPSKFLADF